MTLILGFILGYKSVEVYIMLNGSATRDQASVTFIENIFFITQNLNLSIDGVYTVLCHRTTSPYTSLI
jgi:hypothetical protein